MRVLLTADDQGISSKTCMFLSISQASLHLSSLLHASPPSLPDPIKSLGSFRCQYHNVVNFLVVLSFSLHLTISAMRASTQLWCATANTACCPRHPVLDMWPMVWSSMLSSLMPTPYLAARSVNSAILQFSSVCNSAILLGFLLGSAHPL